MAGANVWNPGTSIVSVNADETLLTQTFSATAAQKVFNLTTFNYALGTGSLIVFKNGLLLIRGTDYAETSTSSFTLTTGATLNDKITALGFVGITGTVGSLIGAAFSQANAYISGSVGEKLKTVINVTDSPWNCVLDCTDGINGTDNTAAFQAVLDYAATLGHGVGIHIPARGGSFMRCAGTVTLPAINGITIQGEGKRSTRLHYSGTGTFISSGLVWATRLSGMCFKDLSITSAGGAIGIDCTARQYLSLINVYINGFTAVNGCGIYLSDGIQPTLINTEISGCYDGILNDAALNSGPNAASLIGCYISANIRYSINCYSMFDWVILGGALEANGSGGIIVTTAGGGIAIIAVYFEENRTNGVSTFDLFIGSSAYIIGGLITACYFNGGSTVDYFPIYVKFLSGFRIENNIIANSTRVYKFIAGGTPINCTFGHLAFANAITPIRDPANAAATYKDLPNNILEGGNIFEDYVTFPCEDTNFVQYDTPYSEHVHTTGGSSTFKRAGTGTTPYKMSNRPVALWTKVNDGTSQLQAAFVISADINAEMLDRWVTVIFDAYNTGGAQFDFNQNVDNAVTANTRARSIGAGTKEKIIMSGYLNSSSALLRSLIAAITGAGTVRVSNFRVGVGMDIRRIPALTGKPQFHSTVIPADGFHAVGDFVEKSNCASGGTPGWSCTTAGDVGAAIGVYKAWGNLA